MTNRTPEPTEAVGPRPRFHRGRILIAGLLAITGEAGCGREFFREWANQDSSEAIFEKSRDPRWRFDVFSIDPPPMSRFANPYDPDVPPAPPDDFAAQALSPVPQWPEARLIVPQEGTGYLDLLEEWRRRPPSTERQPSEISRIREVPFVAPGMQATQDDVTQKKSKAPAPTPPPSNGSAPFGPAPGTTPGNGPNLGTDAAGLSPIPLPKPIAGRGVAAATASTNGSSLMPVALAKPTAKNAGSTGIAAARRPKIDPSTRRTALNEAVIPPPKPIKPATNLMASVLTQDAVAPVPGQKPVAPGDVVDGVVIPQPPGDGPLVAPGEPPDASIVDQLIPKNIQLNTAQTAGLPLDNPPYEITIEQFFTLALTNSRFYQYRLENVYIAALAVTLQRFAFQPQFYAGLSPLTGVAPGVAIGGALGPGFAGGAIPGNAFTYTTRATGTQSSGLNIGTVAGVGKLFTSGGRLLAGFADQLVFNFIGRNAMQPKVQSFLPISFVQPFLRGGGRAVTLEPLTQAERNLLYEIRNFVKFRQEFVIANLVGGQVLNLGQGFNNPGYTLNAGNADPVTGFLNVLQDVEAVEIYVKNVAFYEKLVTIYEELIKGEPSGLSQLQLDQTRSGLVSARQQLITNRTTYRNDLDSLKLQMGLPPDVPIVPERHLSSNFKQTFDRIDEWERRPDRKLPELDAIANDLIHLEDVVIDGRSCFEGFNDPTDSKLNDIYLTAERIALENRLDLMNDRAVLYDAWRQIRVTANALKGVLNVAVTNQIVTPPTQTNPFGFVSQAKQFSLVLNAELPLVRLAERNNFRNALLNFERAKRNLQNQEDFVKIQVRADVRALQLGYQTYELNRQNLVYTLRQRDLAFEQIIAPPAGAVGAAQANNAAIQTTNLISFQGRLIGIETALISGWLSYETQRLSFYRDLGTLPFDEWEAFGELFPSEPGSSRGAPAAFGDDSNSAGAAPAASTGFARP